MDMKKLVRVLLFTVSFVLLLPLTAFAQAAPDYVIKSEEIAIRAVSYTHLDVYKRQGRNNWIGAEPTNVLYGGPRSERERVEDPRQRHFGLSRVC